MHRLLISGHTAHLEVRDKENTTYIEVGKIELILIDPLIKWFIDERPRPIQKH